MDLDSDSEDEDYQLDIYDDLEIFFLLSCAVYVFNLLNSRRYLHPIEDRRIPRIALVDPNLSPWVKVYTSGSERSMVTFTGLNYAAFHFLSLKFEPLYNAYTPYSTSGKIVLKRVNRRFRRPRSLDGRGCLALVLAHLRSKGSLNILSQLFGTTGSVTSLFLRFGRRLLLTILRKIPAAKICMPPLGDIREYQRIVAERYPSLEGVWFFMDGLKLRLQKPVVGSIQRIFYSGWLCQHFISNVFVFCPGGFIIACAINLPGCVHDSQAAFMGHVYDKLQQQNLICGGKGVVDSAFASGPYPFLIKSCQTLPRNARRQVILINQQATALRQSAEWGMRALRASFPRLDEKIPYEENGERMIFLLLIVHLYNFRCRYVGCNQIQTVFLPQLRQYHAQHVMEWNQL